MTDTEQQINQWFANHMEHTAHAASLTAPAIESASDALVNTLLNDGKIITCANGNANASANASARADVRPARARGAGRAGTPPR